jgi:hypothetical protein
LQKTQIFVFKSSTITTPGFSIQVLANIVVEIIVEAPGFKNLRLNVLASSRY